MYLYDGDMSKTLIPTGPVLGIIGPSGVGKSTIVNKLAANKVVHVNPTWTTRARRQDEHSHHEHIFVSQTEFDKLEQAGSFLEVATMFGVPHAYGLPPLVFSEGSVPELIMLRANLVPLLLRHYPNAVIYQIEDHIDRVKPRLEARQTESNEPLGTRLTHYEQERTAGQALASRIFSSRDIDKAVNDITTAITADFANTAT